MQNKLTLVDVLDTRAYERQRDSIRASVMQMRTVRRIHLGTVISLVFENQQTMLYQVQEMARAEKMVTDAQVQHELDTYNELIPAPGFLSATLFIECTTADEMKLWFPRLVGIERSIEIRLGDDNEANQIVIKSIPEASHEAQLTREDTTSAVHYLRFDVGVENAERFRTGPTNIVCTHPMYLEHMDLTHANRESLSLDLS